MKLSSLGEGKLIIITCCALAIAGSGIPVNCAGLFFPQAAAALDTGAGPLTFYLTILYLVAALFLPLGGRLLSGSHAKMAINLAVIVNACAFACFGLVTSLWQIYLLGAVLGLSGAILIFLAIPVLVTNWFQKNVGVALGVPLSCGGLSSAVFSPLIAMCISHFGWRAAYGLCGLTMLLVALPFTLALKPSPEDAAEAENPASGSQADAAREDGLTLKEALSLPVFYLIFFFAGLLGLTSALIVHIPACVEGAGLSSLAASSVLSAVTVGVTLGMTGIGWLNDRFGISTAAIFGVFIELTGIFLLLFSQHLSLAMAGGFCYGFGAATTLVAPPLIVRAVFGMREHTRIYAAVTVCLSICAGLGAALFGFAADLAETYAAALELGVAIAGLAIVTYILISRAMPHVAKLWSQEKPAS